MADSSFSGEPPGSQALHYLGVPLAGAKKIGAPDRKSGTPGKTG
jgi:hypothetical protein